MTRTQPNAQPATRRFFYACIAALALLTGCDDLDVHAQAVDQVAEQQDREALYSRERAGQQVCGPHATAIWESDKSMHCAKERLAP